MNIVENTFANIKQQELRQNPFYSLMSATIDTNPHQIEAYLFALSALKNGGAILADEVGLGKTIEAGLVIKHYFLSGKKNIILIIPSSLRKQWQIELKEKFDIYAKVIDSENIIKYEYSSKKKQNIIIISYNFASNHKKLISDTVWDLCIFDEAHRMRNVHKNGSKMAATLCDITKGIPISVILEDDPEVLRFIKPPLNQMGLYYKAATQYNPDFLVETKDKKYMVEVKAVNQTDTEEVQEKALAGIKWCECASQVDADNKPWEYRLIPGDNIAVGNTFKYVAGMAIPIKNLEN